MGELILRCQSRGGAQKFPETSRNVEGILEILRKVAGVCESLVAEVNLKDGNPIAYIGDRFPSAGWRD